MDARVAATALAATLALASSLTACGGAPATPETGGTRGAERAAPSTGIELALRRADGTFIDVGELRGRVVVLYLFATFDTTSQALLHPLGQIVEADPELRVIGVATQPSARLLVDAYEHALTPPFPITYDPEERVRTGQSDLGPVDAIPMLIVLDARGHVAAQHTGFADRADIEALIARAR